GSQTSNEEVFGIGLPPLGRGSRSPNGREPLTMCDVGHTRRAESVVKSCTEVKGLALLTGGHLDASRRTMGQKR
ncbi:MAG: hypothetical protein QXZ09_04150, partial [Candidatus Methanomethylicaceae archaeon]